MGIDYSQYKLGTVVRYIPGMFPAYVRFERDHPMKPVHGDWIGHITGFTYNEYDTCYEVILRITWFDGRETIEHPNNIEVL